MKVFNLKTESFSVNVSSDKGHHVLFGMSCILGKYGIKFSTFL